LPHGQRRLAAILAADVVGYSRLMAADETGTLARLKTLRAEVIDPKIAQFEGRIVGSAGDSFLVEFASAVNAVQCAVEVQELLASRNIDLPDDRRMAFRMGVNLGDVIVQDDTIYGDGVNVAARLEKLAEPGGVCIDRSVFDQVKAKLAYGYTYLGEQRVHNIAEPVRAYHVLPYGESGETRPILALPDKPSIAVLPFTNMTGDPDQEYFADGIVEEIITALSRMRWLFVIARNSSFTYKGKAVDVKQVGRELGVRYVLEGSVRKAGNRVRITGQLIDALTGSHLWADRFDGVLENIFDLQDQVTSSVVGAIAPKLEQAEIERARRKPTENLDAYDYYLRGMACVHRWTKGDNVEALSHFNRAIEIDPNFAAAYGMAARCYSQRKVSRWTVDEARERAEARRLALRAAELGRDDPVALCTAGLVLEYVVGDIQHGMALVDRALVLDPNYAWGWLFSGWIRVWGGEPEPAIEHVKRAIRLSPHDPQMFMMQLAIASAHYMAGRYAEALPWAQAVLREKPDFMVATCTIAAIFARLGQIAEARAAVEQLQQREPGLRLSNLDKWFLTSKPADSAKWVEGLRLAGLPE